MPTTPTRYRDHAIAGTPAQIANLIANHTKAGTLISMSVPRPATADSAGPLVHIRLRLATTSAPATRRTSTQTRQASPAAARRTTTADRRTRRIVALTVTAVSVLVGVVAVVAYLIGQLVALITAHANQIIAGLVVAAILAALIGSRRTARHCPGC